MSPFGFPDVPFWFPDETDYESTFAGAKITGTARAFTSEDARSDSDYAAAWNDTKFQWDLVSGKSDSSDTKSLGNSYNGDGPINASGVYLSAEGSILGSWSFSGDAHEEGVAKAGSGTYSKSGVVDGKWKLSDEGTTTFADKKDKSNFQGTGVFNDVWMSGTYSRSGSGEGGFEWNIYNGLQGTSGDATWSTSGLSNASSEATGIFFARGTAGIYTYMDSSELTDNGTVNYTYDADTEQFNAASGATVTSIQKASSEDNYSGTGTPLFGSGSVTYNFGMKQNQTNTTTWKVAVADKAWTQKISSSGSYSDKADYVSDSFGAYTSKNHGLAGNWSLVSKDGGTTNSNWSSNYADGAWKHTGIGVIIGYASEDYDKSASGAYTEGVKIGNYSETFKGDGAAGLLIILSRAGDDTWLGSGAAGTGASGSVDISDKWNSVEVEAAHNHYGDETTTTDSDSGKHFDYQVSTVQGLWKNDWRAETGTGSGKGSGWAYLTVATRGTFTDLLFVDASPFIKPDGSPLMSKQLTGTIKGDSTDKLDYSYKNKFTLATAGWTTSETGSGTWKKTAHDEMTVNGSILEIGARSVLMDLGAGGFKYGGFATFDNSRINDSSSNAVFSWSNDKFTMTENTTTSSNIRNNYDSGFYGEMFGSGSGWAEAYQFEWTSDSHHSSSGSTETTKAYTVDQGNIEWVAKYSSDSEIDSSHRTDRVSRHRLILRQNDVTDGVRNEYKSDSSSSVQLYVSGKDGSQSQARWESSSDVTTVGNSIDTYVSSSYSEGINSAGLDSEYWGTQTKWNSAGIIIYQTAWAGDQHTLDADTFSTSAAFSDNAAGLLPTFMLEALGAKGIYSRFTLQGAGAAGTSSFSFSIPPMTFTAGAAISRNQLPDTTLGTTDFNQIGQPADTRTTWQKLKDLVVTETWALIDAGVQKAEQVLATAVWIVDQVSVRAWNGFIKWFAGSAGDGFDQFLDKLGWVAAIAQIPGTIICEPLDWIATGIEVAKDPTEPLNYVGLIPFVPSATGKFLKHADEAAEIAKGAVKLGENGENAAEAAQEIAEQAVKTLDEVPPVNVPVNAPINAADLPWARPGAARAAKAIEAGQSSIKVASRDDAAELVWRMFSSRGFLNTTGRTGSDVRKIVGSKAGTYHWDDVLDAAGNVAGHGADNAHAAMRHVQVHLENGDIIRIFFP